MARKEEIMVDRRIPLEEIQFRISSIEKDVRTLKRLYFIKYRYQRSSVAEASKNVGVTKMVGYYWQESWNMEGFRGLTPRICWRQTVKAVRRTEGGTQINIGEEGRLDDRRSEEDDQGEVQCGIWHKAREEDAEEAGHALFQTLPARLPQTRERRRHSKKT